MFEIHLLHPKVVHFTIGIFGAAVLFEIIAALIKKESLKHAATWNIYLAALSAASSIITSLLAESRVPHNEQAHEIMETHETLGYVILGIILVLAIWRLLLRNRPLQKLESLYLFIAILGIGLTIYSGYLGGEMVYTHGVGVAPVSKLLQSKDHEHGEETTHMNQTVQPEEKTEDEQPQKGELPEQSPKKSSPNTFTSITTQNININETI